MVKIRKYANGIERFLHGEKGQRFFNFAYSIGAAIVIWGALFKILHLPGGSTLLCIGMGTEIAMFILTAFDRPPKEYAWEDVFPVLDSRNPDDRPDFDSHGGGVIVQRGTGVSSQDDPGAGVVTLQPATLSAPADMPDLGEATRNYLEQLEAITAQMEQLQNTTKALNEVSETLLESYRSVTDNSENISANTKGYVERMDDLNRNISGLNTIYEIQLKSISSQLQSIDGVNRGLKDIRDMYEKSANQSSRYCEETERMARYMRQLNQVYEKMITAMTINMANPMMGGAAAAAGINPFEQNTEQTNS